MTKCKSFKAEVNAASKVLILGSMPGVKSLEEAQYYAHPMNRFWKVMGFLCNEPQMVDLAYEMRAKALLDAGFALWDVIGRCEREGSLDSAIKKEVPNDIAGLLIKYPNIKTIYLNGGKAQSAFKKYFPEILKSGKYKVYNLPSTSPANARFRLEDLVREWGISKDPARL